MTEVAGRGVMPLQRLAVVVPSYRRPDDLRRCLDALGRQERPADQVIVVRRDHDQPTCDLLNEPRDLAVQVVVVSEPGLVHAITRGLEAVNADLVAMTDDDAVPRVDWLRRIEFAFQQGHRVAGVGGRDVIADQDIFALGGRSVVGRLTWYGKVIGNHHLGVGPARDVDSLKGVNHAYRTDLLRQVWYDLRLRGEGAQVHSELAIGLDLVKRHWRLIYDPAILVDHYPAPRYGDDQRGRVHAETLTNEVHNETLALLRYLPPLRRLAFFAWVLACGTRAYPGALCWFVEVARRRRHMWLQLSATLRGRYLGVRSWLDERPSRVPRIYMAMPQQKAP